MVAPDAATFREWAGPSAGPATAAVAFAEQHRVVMRGRGATPNSGDPLRTLRHELAHVALYEFLGFHAVRWFDEGYASLAAGEDRNDGFLAVNAALVFRRMPSLAALDTLLTSPRPEVARAGYSLALRAVTDLALIDRVRGLDPLLVEWKARGTLDLALRGAFAVTTEGFERDWQQRTRWRFALLSVVLDSAMGGLALVLLFAPLYRSRRNAQRARLDEMRRREAITELTNRSEAVDTLMRSILPATDASGPHA